MLIALYLLGQHGLAQSNDRSENSRQEYPIPPNKIMLEDPVGFHGYRGDGNTTEIPADIRIGFFAPHTSERSVGGSMWRGATLAVEQANRKGGYKGKPYRLVARWADDPWRAGAALVTRMVYDDRVWAIIGGVDSASTHLAEQIANRTRVPLLAPGATDPTLTHIRVPWMFRLPPADDRQAARLVDAISSEPAVKRLVLVDSTRHDDRVGSKEMLHALEKRGIPPVARFTFEPPLLETTAVAERILNASPDAIVLWCPVRDAIEILRRLAKLEVTPPVYTPLSLNYPAFRDEVQNWPAPVKTLGGWDANNPGVAGRRFVEAFREQYGDVPDRYAAYAYDAAALIVHAVEKAGLNRASIRDRIACDTDFPAVTGPIRWDNGGGNLAQLRLISLPSCSED